LPALVLAVCAVGPALPSGGSQEERHREAAGPHREAGPRTEATCRSPQEGLNADRCAPSPSASEACLRPKLVAADAPAAGLAADADSDDAPAAAASQRLQATPHGSLRVHSCAAPGAQVLHGVRRAGGRGDRRPSWTATGAQGPRSRVRSRGWRSKSILWTLVERTPDDSAPSSSWPLIQS